MVNVTGRLQRLNRALEPRGLARDDWEILRDIMAGLAGQSPYSAEQPQMIEDVFKAMAAEVSELSELSLSKIGDLGVSVIDTGVTIPLLENERARKAAGEIVG